MSDGIADIDSGFEFKPDEDDAPKMGSVEVRHPAPGESFGVTGRVYRFEAGQPVKMSRRDFVGMFGQSQVEARVVDDDGAVLVAWCPIVENWAALLAAIKAD